MRGQFQAVIAISTLALLSLFLPILGLLNTGLIALVTLSQGYKEGLKILLPSAISVALLGALTLGQPVAVLATTLPMWFLVWLFASYLGFSGSLERMVVAVLGVSGCIILYFQYGFDDPMTYWSEVLTPLLTSFQEQGLLKAEELPSLIERLASWMTGIVAIGLFLQIMLSILLGSWWHSYLYKPGKFAADFQSFSLPSWLSALTIMSLALNQLLSGDEVHLVQFFSLLLLAAFFFSGLALFHYLMKNVKSKTLWTVCLYTSMVFFPLNIALALASAGVVDAWVNSRTRVRASKDDE